MREGTRIVRSVTTNRRNDERVDVEVGGETYVLSPEFVIRLSITQGRELSPDELRALAQEADVIRAFDRAINLLSHRARATAELRRRLTRLGMPAGAVDEAIARLTRLGYLDDAAFARQLARGRMLASGQSRFRIRSELIRKGVDGSIADEAIAETLESEDVDERAIIERVAAKKARSLANLDPHTRRRRLYAFLARRGFAVDDITRVVSQQFGESEE